MNGTLRQRIRGNRCTTIVMLALVGLIAGGCGSDDDTSDTSTAPPAGNGDATGDPAAFQPEGTVNFMVPAGPGGGSDVMLRRLAGFYQREFGGTTAVENSDGIEAYETIITEHEGDPQMIGSITPSAAYIRPALLGLDWNWSSFTQLAIFAEDLQFILVSTESDIETWDDFVAAAEDGLLTVAQSSSVGVNQIGTDQLAQAMGVEFEPVAFDSGSDQMLSIIANDVDFGITEPADFMEHYRAGSIRPILVMDHQRHNAEELDDIPAAGEMGLDVDFVQQFRAFMAPPNISADAQAYWIDVIRQWYDSPDYEEYAEITLVFPVFIAGEEAEAYMAEAEEVFKDIDR